MARMDVHALPPASMVVAAPNPVVLQTTPPPAPAPQPPTRADSSPVLNRPVVEIRLPPDRPALQPDLVAAFVMMETLTISLPTLMAGPAGIGGRSLNEAPGQSVNFRF